MCSFLYLGFLDYWFVNHVSVYENLPSLLEEQSWEVLPGMVLECSSSGYGDCLLLLGSGGLSSSLGYGPHGWPRPGVEAAATAVSGSGGSWWRAVEGGRGGMLTRSSVSYRNTFLQTPSCHPVHHPWVSRVPELFSSLPLISSPCGLGCGFPHQHDPVSLSYFWKSSKFLSINSTHFVFQHSCKFMLFKNRFYF